MKRPVLALFSVVSVVGALLFVSLSLLAAAQTDTAVGVSTQGRNAIEVVGVVEQQLFNVVFAGYVTHIDGIPDEALFAPGTSPFARGEAEALFTFRGTGMATGRSILEPLTTTSANVDINFYFNETPLGASFESLDSFAGASSIANMAARYQNIINVQEPNVGVFMMYGSTEQLTAEPFTLNGQTHTLGRVGLVGRSENFGQGFRSSVEPLAANYMIVGNIVSPFSDVQGN